MAKDPVCGMTIDEARAAASVVHQDRTYHFCSEGCRTKFLQDPNRYAGNDRSKNG